MLACAAAPVTAAHIAQPRTETARRNRRHPQRALLLPAPLRSATQMRGGATATAATPLLGLLRLFGLLSLASLLLAPHVRAAPCVAPPPLDPSVPVRVAILVYCNTSVGVMPDNPIRLPAECVDRTTRGFAIKAYFEGVDMYVHAMGEQIQAAGGMPLTTGGKATFTYTFVNLGYMDWTDTAASFARLAPSMGNETSGLLWDILMTSQHGGPYTFVVPQMFSRDAESVTMASICEEQSACMLVHPFSTAPPFAICYKDEHGALPTDCVRHHKLEGMRRFDNFLGVMFDSTTVAVSALDTYHLLGVESVVIVSELGGVGGLARFAVDAALRTAEFAKQLNIKVLKVVTLELCDQSAKGNCLRKPDGTLDATQMQTYPDGQTREEFAAMIAALNPDALVGIVSTTGGAQLAFAALFDGFRAVNWRPKMLNWAGGGDAALKPYMRNYNDMLYSWSTQPWDGRLNGPGYHNEASDSNFELFPATADMDGPEVYATEWNKRYGAGYGPRGYNFETVNALLPVIGYHALTIVQKLIENALSADIRTLILASLRVSVPSAWHQLQFDPYGRTNRVNEMLLQYIPGTASAHGVQLIAPYGIGEPVVFPTPTFDEEVYRPSLYEQPVELVMAAVTAVAIAACLAMLVVILAHARHAVIRAATPSFCALTILGAILMLMSNYFHTLVASDSHCAAQVWLLSLGFTLLFSSLFIKTFRIWKIFFSSKKLVVQKMKDSTMLMAVLAFVLVDIVINAAWAGSAGMNMREIVVDPIRPAFNYRTCDYSDSLPAVYTHLGVKCGLLLFGIVLTWAVRHTPSQFNESSFIGVCIYNVSIVIAFVVPLLSSAVGGRTATVMIRAFAIIFVTLSTVAILYVPKLLAIYGGAGGPGGLMGGGGGGMKTVYDADGNASIVMVNGDGNQSIYADPEASRSSAGTAPDLNSTHVTGHNGAAGGAGHSFHKSKEREMMARGGNSSGGGTNSSNPGATPTRAPLKVITRITQGAGVPASPSGTHVGAHGTPHGGNDTPGRGGSTQKHVVSTTNRSPSPEQTATAAAATAAAAAALQAEEEEETAAAPSSRYIVTIMPGQIGDSEGNPEAM